MSIKENNSYAEEPMKEKERDKKKKMPHTHFHQSDLKLLGSLDLNPSQLTFCVRCGLDHGENYH